MICLNRLCSFVCWNRVDSCRFILSRQFQTCLIRSQPVLSEKLAIAGISSTYNPRLNSNGHYYRQYYDSNYRYFSAFSKTPNSSKAIIIKLIANAAALGIFSYGIYLAYIDYLDQVANPPIDYEQFEPVPFPNNDEELRALHYRRVKLRGQFEHEKEMLIGPRKNLQKNNDNHFAFNSDGYYILTPFILSDTGRRILVNRGWVSTFRKDPFKRTLGQIEGETELNAFVVVGEEPLDLFTKFRTTISFEKWIFSSPGNIDLEKMSNEVNIDPIALFIVDKGSTPKNGPVGGQFTGSQDQFRYLTGILCCLLALLVRKIGTV